MSNYPAHHLATLYTELGGQMPVAPGSFVVTSDDGTHTYVNAAVEATTLTVGRVIIDDYPHPDALVTEVTVTTIPLRYVTGVTAHRATRAGHTGDITTVTYTVSISSGSIYPITARTATALTRVLRDHRSDNSNETDPPAQNLTQTPPRHSELG
jgi:hypothetical protein